MLTFDLNCPRREELVVQSIQAALKQIIDREVKHCVSRIEKQVFDMMPKIEVEVYRTLGSDYGRVSSDSINVVLKYIENEAIKQTKE